MATIDKALPNVKQTLTIPGPEEIQIDEQQKLQEQEEAGNLLTYNRMKMEALM